MPQNEFSRDKVSAIILAGGRGRRMGGQAKAWITLDYKPLIAHVVARLRPQVDEIVISANDDAQKYEHWSPKVVADDLPQLGPLGGLTSAGRHITNELILLTPCDTPFLPLDLVSRMKETLRDKMAQLAVARDPERTHYAILMMHHSLLADAENFLKSGGRAIKEWIAQHASVEVAFDSTQVFMNINTPEDLERCEEIL